MDEQEKISSWAPTRVPSPEEYESVEFEANREAALDQAQINTANALVRIAYLVERLVVAYEALAGIESEDTPEPVPPPRDTKPRVPVPENLAGDQGAEEYYREQINDALSSVLSESQLENTTIMVEEDSVLIKLPYLGDKNTFGRAAGTLREQLGGEYVSAGKDSHFRLPKP